MDVFLARQPIFDLNQEVYAYEVLYRSGISNAFSGEVDDDAASSKVILDTFQNFGLETITSGKPAFINFSSTLIEKDIATLLSPEYLVVEVLERVDPSPKVIKGIRDLRDLGYKIALDDFVYSRPFEPLLDLADIVKVDFQNTSLFEIKKLRARLLTRNAKLLAEKIETWEEFRLAKEQGFILFQGYYFQKPEMLTTTSLTPLEINHLQLVAEVNRDEVDFMEVAKIISTDLAFTYNLLKLINSAAFRSRERINSIQQAVVMLGEKELRKWITLIVLQGMSVSTMSEPVGVSLVRGRFAQLLAQRTRLREHQDALFMTGLFSMLDVLLQRPLETILNDVHAPEEVKDALLHNSGPYKEICSTVMAYEKGDWGKIAHNVETLNLDGSTLADSYMEAIQWYPLTR
jgi:EAL and modified HD-GYP domain-containing signal transduction protein